MKKVCLLGMIFLHAHILLGQTVSDQLKIAMGKLQADSQMRHAIFSFYVIDGKTGKLIFDKNSQIGSAPASCQKLFTSAAAFELLGHDYCYKTELGYDGEIKDSVLNGNLYIIGSGDPTLGSWRYSTTVDTLLLNKWVEVIQKEGIKKINGNLVGDDSKFETQSTPDGWIWQDIGNYYGAGVWGLNWHENQYDLKLKPGKKVGDPCTIISTYPELEYNYLVNELKTGEKGSGDNAYIYYPPYSFDAFIRGTIPLGEDSFVIGGAMAIASHYPARLLMDKCKKASIKITGEIQTSLDYIVNEKGFSYHSTNLFEHISPSLDSINYWFLKKSINLYGEALIKTMAYKKIGFGSTEKGIEILKDFWNQQAIEKSAINITDGSGLSPQNRVTTDALVKALQYAVTRPWFTSFYKALPDINGMKMKSGSIGGARSYAGYQRGKDGREYIFAIIQACGL